MTTLKPRMTSITIFQGDDMAVLAELRRAASVAERIAAEAVDRAEDVDTSIPRRIGDDLEVNAEEVREAQDEAKRRRDAYDAFVDEAADRALIVELHAIGRKRFRDLMAEHPPRKVKVTAEPVGDEPAKETQEAHGDDNGFDVNTETFPTALLTYIDPSDPEIRTIAAPEFASRKAVADFLDNDLADGDFPGLWMAAYQLNRALSFDPKLTRFSNEPRSTTET